MVPNDISINASQFQSNNLKTLFMWYNYASMFGIIIYYFVAYIRWFWQNKI